MSNLLENFLKNVYVRTKHVEKSCVGLWGQSLILEATRLIFEVNQAEVGGYVTP